MPRSKMKNVCQKCGSVAFSPAFSWMARAGFQPSDVVCLDCYANTLRSKFKLRTRNLDMLMMRAAAKMN
jgi:hypothetical protein